MKLLYPRYNKVAYALTRVSGKDVIQGVWYKGA